MLRFFAGSALRLMLCFCCVLLLAGCLGAQEEQSSEQASLPPYYVSTQPLASFGQSTQLTKNGRIIGEQELTVTAKARGTVQSVPTREGQEVGAGSVLLTLADTVDNLNISLSRAELSAQRAQLQYEQNKKNLDKSIADARIALQRAQNNVLVTKKNTEQSVKQAELELLRSSPLLTGSLASLDFERSATDLQNQVTSLKNNFDVQYDALTNVLDNVTYQADLLLGVSRQNQLENDDIEDLLGARNVPLKTTMENELRELFSIQRELDTIRIDTSSISNEQLLEQLEEFEDYYQKLDSFLRDMIVLIEASVSGVGLSEQQIDGLIQTFRGLQSSYAGNYAGFVQYQANAKTLFSTIVGDDTRTLLEQQLTILATNQEFASENAQIAYTNAITAAEDARAQAQFALEQAQNTYENLLATRDEQLSLLQNAVEDAKAARQNAAERAADLLVRAPIQASVAEVLVDRGQEVSPGTPLFRLVNRDMQQVEIFVGAQEVELIDEQTDVQVLYQDTAYPGVVSSISRIANQNLQYKVIVALQDPLPLVGEVVQVQLPIVSDYLLLPLDVVTVTQSNTGYIYTYDATRTGANALQREFVPLGRVYGDFIQLREQNMMGSTPIVTNSVENFDATKFRLQVRDSFTSTE